MSTPEAIQHLIEHVKRMHANFFATNILEEDSQTSYNNVVLTITNSGLSSVTKKTIHFLVNLGAYQPGDSKKIYNIWVENPSDDNPRVNQAAVAAALKSLIDKGTWGSVQMVSMPA